MTKVVCLCSGGLDSTTLVYWLVNEGFVVQPLFFNYGQHCADKEWSAVWQLLNKKRSVLTPVRKNISDIFCESKSRLIHEPDLWSENVTAEDLFLPYRTLVLFSLGAAVAQIYESKSVYAGFINSNYAKEADCTSVFLNSLEQLAQGLGDLEVRMPFREWSKNEVARLGAQLGVPVASTFSCQIYSDVPCGVCPNCVDRQEALSRL